MSALTSHSPSPAASPRSSFHIQRAPAAYHHSPSPRSARVPRPSWSSGSSALSPKASASNFHAKGQSSGSGGGARQKREHYVESPPVEKEPRYVHAGTQYSPDGYPPTAKRIPGKEKERPGTTSTVSAGKKRKEPQREADAMSTSGASSSGSSAQLTHPPPEPEPRRDPTPAASASASTAPGPSSTRAGPFTNNEPEPEEARSTQHPSTKRSRPEPGSAKVMPLLYQTCNPADLGHLISSMLMELIRLNDRIPLRDGRLTRFHSRAPPGISVSDYLQRLIKHATLSPPILLSMVWYIDRLCQLYPAFTINSLTVHRFLITAATVAAKGLSDSFWTNPIYAKIGGIPVSELATLELEFLEKVQWKIVPQPEVLEEYYTSLVDRMEGYELEQQDEKSSGSTSVGSSDEDEEKDDEQKGERGKEDEHMADGPT